MQGIGATSPAHITLKADGSNLTVDVETMGQVLSANIVHRRSALPVMVRWTGKRGKILGTTCREATFTVIGRGSGDARMVTTGVVWTTGKGKPIAENLSATNGAAFGLPGGDFETFIALLSRVKGIPCRIESETALQGTSEIVDAIRLPIRIKAVLTAVTIEPTQRSAR
jgi:hypothetical protein